MKYIAYGSNMVEEQMAHRCPNARLIGMGQLPNHRLEFYLHATVERRRAAPVVNPPDRRCIMAVATPGDVAVELGRDTPADTTVEYKQWGKWLDRAERQIRQRI